MGILGKKKILIVDDVEINREILTVILKDEYYILEADNGRSALEILEKEHNISLIMLDIVMPVMDGFQFLECIEMKPEYTHIPIIFVTSETSKENILKGAKKGVCDVIAKPFDPYLICTRVDHLIALTENREKNQLNMPLMKSSLEVGRRKPEIALIVEDVEINRGLIKATLQNDYKIIEAENGQIALELLKEHEGNIAVVLLDIIMPVMNGVEMMDKANHYGLLNHVPVIAITVENSPITMKRLKDLGICEIIHKPFDTAIAANRIHYLIELYG